MINADQSKEQVHQQLALIVNSVLDNKQSERESMREMFVIKLNKQLEEKAKLAAEAAAADVAIAADKSFDDGDMIRTGEMSKQSVERDATGRAASKERKTAENQNEPSIDNSKSGQGLINNISCATIPPQLPDRDNLDNDFKPVIIEMWRDLAKNYKGQMRRVFRNIRLQREQASIRQSELKMQFLEFLHTSDGKQAILDEFVKNFNSFSDEYPDLREDDQTKEELHQRTDSLSDELWEIVEERKEMAIEFRKKIMESGFVEFNLEFLTQIAQQLMQAEVDKFKIQV